MTRDATAAGRCHEGQLPEAFRQPGNHIKMEPWLTTARTERLSSDSKRSW
jgi:hypothetical protein